MINKVNKTDTSRTLQRITANEQTFQSTSLRERHKTSVKSKAEFS